MSSDYALPLLVIGALIVFDVFAGVAYFGERNKNRRRYYSVAPIRPYYGYNRRYYGNGVGRIGDADVDNESSQFAFQRSDKGHQCCRQHKKELTFTNLIQQA